MQKELKYLIEGGHGDPFHEGFVKKYIVLSRSYCAFRNAIPLLIISTNVIYKLVLVTDPLDPSGRIYSPAIQ